MINLNIKILAKENIVFWFMFEKGKNTLHTQKKKKQKKSL